MPKATIKEVAAAAEVSVATVSRVLNSSGYVSPEVKERVNAAIARLHYQPNAVARSLKQDKTCMIGVIIPDISNPYFMEIARGIEDTVSPANFQIIFCSSDEAADKEARLLRLLREKRVDAVVLATAGGNAKSVCDMHAAGTPIILIDRGLEPGEAGSPGAPDTVLEDNEHGAYLLTKRLLDDGHVRLGVVSGPDSASTGRERYSGVLRAWREAGMDSLPLVYCGNFSVEDGKRAMRGFLAAEQRPTAVVSLNNRMSFGVVLELLRHKLRIPGDMAVASFGEVEAGLLLDKPGLYYIEQRPYDMGVKAGELLLRRMGDRNVDAVVERFRNVIRQM